MSDAFSTSSIEPRINFVTRDVLAARGLVRSGLAVTLVPELVAGLFEDVAAVPESYTGQYLAPYLRQRLPAPAKKVKKRA